jgi:hypothetical protein
MIIRLLTVGATAIVAAGLLCTPAAAQPSAAGTTPVTAETSAPGDDVHIMLGCGVYDRNKPTTRSETLSRSATWLGKVPYNQGGCYENQFGNYREDCSGYVSMIWKLRSSYTTDTLDQVAHDINRSDLRTGDALLKAGQHVALFIRWEDAAHTKPRVREHGGPGTAHEDVWSQAYAAGYRPIRYDNIREDAAPRDHVDGTDIDGDGAADLLGVKDGALLYFHNDGTEDRDPFNGSGATVGSGFNVFDWVDGADFSGDGSGDLLARETDGTLLYYPNNRSHNPGGVPFSGPGVQIGHGWGAFSAIDAGDIDGDGRADLLALKPDGALLYYHNDGTEDGDPFNGSGVQIGSGFNAFDWIDAADISGDRSADLLARKPDGTLWYYGNNRSHNPGGVPFTGSGTEVGHGFDGFDVINAADLSGDGSADMFARKPDGTLWYFPNNRYHNPGGVPFVGPAIQIGHGFQTFTKLT